MRLQAVLLLALITPSGSDAQQPLYHNIGVNEGLPSTEVYCMLQDHAGYMWFSTDAGVCRFNGSTFNYFTTQNGLSDNTIFHLLEDDKGRMWMAGYNGSICLYDNGEVRTIAASAALQQELQKGTFLILSLQFDDADTLWVGTTRNLFKIPAERNYSTLLTDHTADDSIHLLVKNIARNKFINADIGAIEKNKKITGHRLNCLVSDRIDHFYVVYNQKFNPVFFSATGSDGSLFFSYNSQVIHQKADGTRETKTFPQSVIFLGCDKQNNLLVGLAKGGLYRYPACNFNLVPEHFFSELSVSNCITDFENGFWVSTLEKGVFYSPFDSYRYYYDQPGLCDKITGLAVVKSSSRNYLLVSNYKNEFFRVERDTAYLFSSIPEQAASSRYSLHQFNDKVLFSGNRMGEMDINTGRIDYYMIKPDIYPAGFDVAEISPGKFSCIVYGSYADIENGFIRKTILTPTRGTCMLKDKEGRIWVGTLSGLFYLDSDKFIPCSDSLLDKERITALAEDREGRLFICTKNRGLFFGKEGRWKHIDASNGLTSNVCNDVLCDENGRIWVATGAGVSFFNLGMEDSVSTIDATDGLPSNETSSLARLDDYLFVGTRNGLSRIDLTKTYLNLTAPYIYLDNILINDSIPAWKDHALPYDENGFSFRIHCVTYKNMFRQRWWYRLSGQDSTFRYSENLSAEFQNLDPGNYRFIAYAINNMGIKSKDPVTFAFVIHKPWWRTWWFITLALLCSTGVVIGVTRSSVQRVNARREERSKMERLIAEYQLSAVRAQMNPHFIFNAINSIQNFILSNETQSAYDYLAKFGKLIRQVLVNSQEQTNSLQKEIELLTIYIELEQQRFSNKFSFEVTLEPELRTDEIMVPVLLVQPYVENAIWHGIMNLDEHKKGKLLLDFRMEGTELKITIEDNGVGRNFNSTEPKSSTHRSMGMMLSEKRLDAINVTNEEENHIEVTDLKDAQGRPLGTRVELYLTVTL